MEKLTSTVERKQDIQLFWTILSEDKRQKDSSYSRDTTLEACNMVEGLASDFDLLLS